MACPFDGSNTTGAGIFARALMRLALRILCEATQTHRFRLGGFSPIGGQSNVNGVGSLQNRLAASTLCNFALFSILRHTLETEAALTFARA
jgi:hypothetical protein